VLRALAETGYRGLVAVELPRHSHAAPDVAAARSPTRGRLESRGGRWRMMPMTASALGDDPCGWRRGGRWPTGDRSPLCFPPPAARAAGRPGWTRDEAGGAAARCAARRARAQADLYQRRRRTAGGPGLPGLDARASACCHDAPTNDTVCRGRTGPYAQA
jgi:hypothetical protein